MDLKEAPFLEQEARSQVAVEPLEAVVVAAGVVEVEEVGVVGLVAEDQKELGEEVVEVVEAAEMLDRLRRFLAQHNSRTLLRCPTTVW